MAPIPDAATDAGSPFRVARPGGGFASATVEWAWTFRTRGRCSGCGRASPRDDEGSSVYSDMYAGVPTRPNGPVSLINQVLPRGNGRFLRQISAYPAALSVFILAYLIKE